MVVRGQLLTTHACHRKLSTPASDRELRRVARVLVNTRCSLPRSSSGEPRHFGSPAGSSPIRGKSLIQKGKLLIQKGESLIQKGESLIQKGGSLIQKGESPAPSGPRERGPGPPGLCTSYRKHESGNAIKLPMSFPPSRSPREPDKSPRRPATHGRFAQWGSARIYEPPKSRPCNLKYGNRKYENGCAESIIIYSYYYYY